MVLQNVRVLTLLLTSAAGCCRIKCFRDGSPVTMVKYSGVKRLHLMARILQGTFRNITQILAYFTSLLS